jgi:hypothetical protein
LSHVAAKATKAAAPEAAEASATAARRIADRPTHGSADTTRRPRVQTEELDVHISSRLKEAAQKAAVMDQRTLSSPVVHLLTQYCREAGTLKEGRFR